LIRVINGNKVNINFLESNKKSRESRKKSLTDSLNNKNISFSLSHSNNISACIYSLTSKNLGIDIEPLDRYISVKLKKILSLRSRRLYLKNIELWCLMEAAFKACPDIQHQHFLNYDFERSGKLFYLKQESRKKVYLKIFRRKGFVYAVALEE